MKKLVLAAALLVLCIISLAACTTTTADRTSYTIQFDPQGGSTTGSVSTNGNEVIIMPEAPSKLGYLFGGWFTDNVNYSQEFTSNYLLYHPITSGMTVYAKWETPLNPNEDPLIVGYEVSYVAGDADAEGITPTQENVFAGDMFTVATNTFINAGCDFVCWTDGTTTYLPGSQYTSGSSPITLTAVWDAIDYVVVYRLDGGSNAASNPVSYTVRTAYTLFSATKTGFDFDGWYNNALCSGIPLTTIEEGGTGELELFAKWVPSEFIISYALGGGQNDIDNPASYNMQSGEIVLEAAEKSYYSFDGWFSDAAKTQAVTGIASGSMGNKTFYASWTPNEYEAVFSYMGTPLEELTLGVAYGAGFSLPDCPAVNQTMIFVCWAIDFDLYQAGMRTTMTSPGMEFEAVLTSIYYATPGMDFNDSAGRVTGYDGTSPIVYVPASHGGRAVESIGNYAFAACDADEIYLPYTLNYIAPYAFYGCTAKLHFPQNSMLTAIGDAAFLGYTGTEIVLPEGLTSIGQNAFACCENLLSVEIPSGVETIYNYTFAGCTALEEIVIGDGVTEISEFAFSGCSALISVTVLAETPPAVVAGAFSDCDPSFTVYVPADSLEAYQAALGWSELTLEAIEN